jgi:hypothetical protein
MLGYVDGVAQCVGSPIVGISVSVLDHLLNCIVQFLLLEGFLDANFVSGSPISILRVLLGRPLEML